MQGLMMDFQLTVTSVMEHGRKLHGNTEVVSSTSDHDRHRTTFGEVFGRAGKLAHLFAKEGIKRGDRIATLAWNDFRHMELYFGISCYGAVCHTINPRLHPDQIDFIVNDAEDQLLFIDAMFVDLVKPLRERFKTVKKIIVMTSDRKVIEGLGNDWAIYEDVIADLDTDYDWPALDEGEACSLCYTSGTTGNPKGVLYSHRSTVLHSLGANQPDAIGIRREDVVLPVVPMFHVNAWGLPYVAAMTGCKMVFPGAKVGVPSELYKLLDEEEVTFTAGVPTVWQLLRDHMDKNNLKLPKLHTMVVGGSAMPPHLYRYYEEEHGLVVNHAWGMTEMSPIGTANQTLPPAARNLSKEEQMELKLKQGMPVYGVEMKIVDDNGHELPWDGEASGSLMVRGPWIIERYMNKDETALTHGWFDTGDVASMDKFGIMKITDRKKDVIKSGGEWISSIDVENAVMLHPEIPVAAVIGMPHPKWGERPLLVIERSDKRELSLQEIHDWLDGKVASWWKPNEVVYVDKIPLTATGKMHKLTLRDQLEDFSFDD
ncbi:long-chain-fatty-acid--CoA ligase [Ectothiorhodospiraceae bacterium WFHF3C12]|nr:long-chain-fatty-acid--CoA ligase [Ectothiorhodospiraceae bacterium WFHF3C12]